MKPYYGPHAGITIYHGDCREVLPALGRFDLCLTDPPYGINAARIRNSQKWGWTDFPVNDWDRERADPELIRAVLGSGRHVVLWGGNYWTDVLPVSSKWFIWDKKQRDFSLADAELAWCSWGGAVRVFDYSRAAALQDGKQHPTQKPESLIRWCIKEIPESPKSIVDPFTGSGTTLVVAKNLGIDATGIEIEERYCEIAAKRLAQEVLNFQEVTCPREGDYA